MTNGIITSYAHCICTNYLKQLNARLWISYMIFCRFNCAYYVKQVLHIFSSLVIKHFASSQWFGVNQNWLWHNLRLVTIYLMLNMTKIIVNETFGDVSGYISTLLLWLKFLKNVNFDRDFWRSKPRGDFITQNIGPKSFRKRTDPRVHWKWPKAAFTNRLTKLPLKLLYIWHEYAIT